MVLNDLASYLHAAGVVINVDGPTRNVFWSTKAKIPDGDGPYLSLISYGGEEPWLMHKSDTIPGYERPKVQLTARAATWESAYQMARNAFTALVQKRTLTINGTYYVSIDPMQDPTVDLGLDEAGRVKCGFNVRIVKRP